MLLKYRQKLSLFTNFPANMFLFGVRKNICTAPFPDAQELLSWSTLKANVCIFLYISLRKCLSQRRSKILSDGGWERLNNFLEAVHYLGLVKYFTIFHFNFVILIQLFFSISILASIALKRWNFPDNLDLKGKIMVKFLMRNNFLSI